MERLPGFRDFYPEPLPNPDVWSADARQYVFAKWRETARRYGFREYDGPPLEPLELFTIKSGEEIVGQLYNFVDKGDRAVALRPEMTPTLARMVAAHERNYKKPIKWFAIPQLFRCEKHQTGRKREHFQFNADIVGEPDVAADAELLALLIDSLRSFGLTADHFVIRLSSRNAWQDFFSKRCDKSSKAYEFYQVIDKLERETPEQSELKLAALGFSLDEVNAFIRSAEPSPELGVILKNLSARGLGEFVKVDYHVIRGLAYYTGVVFEAFDKRGEFRAIAGGGRYDNLVKLISGGKGNLPALGFGMGDVVLSELLKDLGKLPKSPPRIDVLVVPIGEEMLAPARQVVRKLRLAGERAEAPFAPMKVGKAFQAAELFGARRVVLVGPDEWREGKVKVKDLASREETVREIGSL